MECQNPEISKFEMSPGALKESQIMCLRLSLSFKDSHNNWVASHDSPAVPPWLRGGMQVYCGKCYFTVGSVHGEQGHK